MGSVIFATNSVVSLFVCIIVLISADEVCYAERWIHGKIAVLAYCWGTSLLAKVIANIDPQI